MGRVVQEFVSNYESLPFPQRQEVLIELLKRFRTEPHDLPSDEDLIAAADTLFQELDQHERET
jgi:hypothetical protein